MSNATKRYERTDVYAETFRLKATDDLIKKLKLEITQLKEENDSLKRVQGGLEVMEEDIMEMEVKAIRGEGKGAEESPTIMPVEMTRSSWRKETWSAWGTTTTLPEETPCVS